MSTTWRQKEETIDSPVSRSVHRCRICGSAELEEVIDLGDQYIASIFTNEPIPPQVNQPFPLGLVRCASADGCGLVQLGNIIDPEILYDHYGYRSGTNEMMRANLRDIVEKIEQMIELHAGDVVLDIGCNDGTLLGSYSSSDIKRLGIDPSDAVKDISDPAIDVVNDFFTLETANAATGGAKARVVTSIAMFYDLEAPQEFVRDVAQFLSPDGIWVLELSYLPFMLRSNSFDTICHEHQEYYALRQLEWLLREQDLAIHRAELNDVNGGSIRLFIRPGSLGEPPSEWASDLKKLRDEEENLQLHTDRPYKVFRDAVATVRDDLRHMFSRLIAAGKVVYIYGASTKGNVLLQYCGIDKWMAPKAADRNPDKWGTRTLGTEILIVSEDEARSDKPDYFLVLPWHFMDSFLPRETEFLDGGGRFIVPLPKLRVVGKGGEVIDV